MDLEEIERLHNSGKMPDWYYYQVNGKSAWENYAEQFNKISKKNQIERELEIYKAKRKAEIEAELEAELEKQIEEKAAPEIEKVLDKLLADWQ